MCGIIGYCSKNGKASQVIFEDLKRMEYRGYDSSGVAMISDGKLLVKKGVGKLEEVNRKYKLDKIPGSVGIGHTRWATHGGVTQINTHPHCDCRNEIAVIHNGIVDNYQELRKDLIKRKHRFLSETDTEVIPHMLEDEMKRGRSLEEAVMAVAPRLEGSYAFLAISTNEPGKVVGTRKGSPLVVGLGKNKAFAASDSMALAGQIDQLYMMGEGEIAVLTADKTVFFDSTGRPISKKATKPDAVWNDNNKEGYEYFMLKEIMEQPDTLLAATHQDKDVFTAVALDVLRADQIIVTACGSSRYAALVGRYLFSSVGKKFCEVVMASEFQYFAESVSRNSLVLAISQSGETLDVIDGVELARKAGARIVSIINRPQSLLGELSHNVLYLNCGPEIGVAATKSFLNQLAIFYLLAFSMVHSFDMAVDNIRKVSRQVARAIDWNNDVIAGITKEYHDKNDFYYIARGINFAIASEGALKLKEISYIHAEGMPAGELKHGTLSLIEEGTPVLVICPGDFTYKETLGNAIEAKARGARIIAVSDVNNEVYDHWIRIPRVHDLLYPMVSVVPLQLLAYHMATRRGRNPDMPRNLAKSVTVR
ncbi:MAG: glutamine--fructose-6-phosphate transaminase (isomerizing) [Dehalococcoidia bacterium]|nr:glutamine--fructose-6-phosphate transaminase (isomerizing) [Dehalococcoidia bacterium]